MQSEIQAVYDWFITYMTDYLADSSPATALMELKRVHSLAVAAHSRAIAVSEKWPEDECDLAELIGLVHDAGRFSQLAQFGTFSDTVSVDHGERGFEVLSTSGILNSVDNSLHPIILDSVRYHNRRFVPDWLDTGTIRFLHAVRDSDKLDIFRVIHEALEQGQIDKHPEITLNIDLNGPITPAAFAEVEARQNVSYDNVNSLADFGLAQLAWLYDLHFSYSYHQVIEQGILDRILTTLPEESRINNLADDITRYIAQQIEENITQ